MRIAEVNKGSSIPECSRQYLPDSFPEPLHGVKGGRGGVEVKKEGETEGGSKGETNTGREGSRERGKEERRQMQEGVERRR